MHMPDVLKSKKDRKHKIKSLVFTITSTYLKNEIIWINISKTKTDVFIAVVLKCSRWNLLIFIGYFCKVFYLKNVEKI